METNDERRKRRLQALCDDNGGVKLVAAKARLGWEGLDQILKGALLPMKADGRRERRSLGNPAARAIEAAYDLGIGWLDWPFAAVDLKRYWALSELDKGVVQAAMMDAIERVERRHDQGAEADSVEYYPLTSRATAPKRKVKNTG